MTCFGAFWAVFYVIARKMLNFTPGDLVDVEDVLQGNSLLKSWGW